MQDYESRCVTAVICATLVNAQTHRQLLTISCETQLEGQLYKKDDLQTQ